MNSISRQKQKGGRKEEKGIGIYREK